MTFPQNVNSFSPVFRQTIMQASVRQIKVKHDTSKQAQSLAAAMRSYVGKLYKAAEKDTALVELAQAARACMFRVEGLTFIAQPRDMDARFDRLKAALSADDGAPVAGEADASLEILMAKMNESKGESEHSSLSDEAKARLKQYGM